MFLSSDWLKKETLATSIDVLRTLACFEAERSGSYRDALLTLLREHRYEELISFQFDYSRPILDIIHGRQCVGFFEKFEPLGRLLKVDRKDLAFKKFLDSERSCGEVNQWFQGWRTGSLCSEPGWARTLFSAQRKIRSILGPCPDFAALDPVLGPGASTTTKRRMAVPSIKLRPPFACSPNSVQYLGSIFSCLPHLLPPPLVEGDDEVQRVDVEIHPGRLEFVPKDAKSYRSIVVEPVLTSMYQLAIGAAIERRLRYVGIDIRDQTRNQRLARLGSIDGSLATIDLSSASDTISYELVRFLLPDDWFDLLRAFRSPQVSYQGNSLTLEKFSSMGNGFTFPLETLVFYGLCYAVCTDRGSISVYGDDIIVASSDFPAVSAALSLAGFTVNEKKSFSHGPFRESCGKDYVHGIAVRPYRQKGLVSNQSLFVLHNFYKRNYDDEGSSLVLSLIHPELRVFGPDGFGDGHLLGDWIPKRHK